jgi:hypothetical protein
MEQWWNDDYRGKEKKLRSTSMVQCHFIYDKWPMKLSRIEPVCVRYETSSLEPVSERKRSWPNLCTILMFAWEDDRSLLNGVSGQHSRGRKYKRFKLGGGQAYDRSSD